MTDDTATTDASTGPHGWADVPRAADIAGPTFDAAHAQEPGYSGPDVAVDGAAPAALPYAPRPRRRLGRGPLIGIIAGGSVLLLVLVAVIGGVTLANTRYAPERQVEAFLDDLTAGHAEKAMKAAGIDAGADDLLLTDAAYAKATDRVSAYRINGVSKSGSSATVDATLRQGGSSVRAQFTLSKDGTDLGVFPKWRLDPVRVGAVDVYVQAPAGTTVTIAGVPAKTGSDGTVDLRALPGRYDVAVDGGGYFTAETTKASVGGFGGTATSPVNVRATLTDKGTAAATAAVDSWVDGCIASTEFAPQGCSFYATTDDPTAVYSNEKWTLNTRPQESVGDWAATGWTVTTTSPGSATLTATFTSILGNGTGTAGPITFYADGVITGFTSKGAVFVPAITNQSGAGTGS